MTVFRLAILKNVAVPPSIPSFLLSIAPRWPLPPFTPNLILSALPAPSRKKLLDFLI
jgi:hypothetical protein